MGRLANYYQTLKDGLSGKVTPAQAFKVAKNTPGGVVGEKSLSSVFRRSGGRIGGFNRKAEDNKIQKAIDKDRQEFNSSAGNKEGVQAPAFDFSSIEASSGSGGGGRNQSVIKGLSRGWDDTKDLYEDTSKSLKKSNKFISNLGKVRDQFVDSLNKYKQRYDEKIAGNKKLIQQNQKSELDDLAGDTRKSIKNTNVMLGVSGASGGSASKMASRAIAKSAGKTRADILTRRGDEMGYQRQAEENAKEEYELKMKQADEWERKERKRAKEEYSDAKRALKRLAGKRSGWKKEDIEAESDRNLEKYIESLLTIQANGRAMRDNLALKMEEFGGSADALELESINVDAPAELDTPEFSENIDFNSEDDAEDWYDPNNKNKQRVVVGYDALGNPIYKDQIDNANKTVE